jgi:hypothetical protein
LWCAGSTASIRLSNGVAVNRLALFYVPESNATLPPRVDKSLTGRCELLSFWYSVDNASSLADFGLTDFANAVARELGADWGAPETVGRTSPVRRGWGWGYWDPFFHWRQQTHSVIVAVDPKGRPGEGRPGEGKPGEGRPESSARALVVVRHATYPDAALDHTLNFTPVSQPFTAGSGEDIAGVTRLENPCSFEGKSDWREALIAFGENMLAQSARSQWTPFVHWILGRAYAARLQLTYPGTFMDVIAPQGPLDPVRIRESAISHFRSFLADKPNGPDAQFARSEAWRLLAGLPPTPIHFGCTNE